MFSVSVAAYGARPFFLTVTHRLATPACAKPAQAGGPARRWARLFRPSGWGVVGLQIIVA